MRRLRYSTSYAGANRFRFEGLWITTLSAPVALPCRTLRWYLKQGFEGISSQKKIPDCDGATGDLLKPGSRQFAAS